MTNRIKKIGRLGLVLCVSSLALAACSDNDDDVFMPPEVDPPAPPPQMGSNFEDQFGDGFAAAYNVDANGEPIEVEADGVIEVDKTIDPVEIPEDI